MITIGDHILDDAPMETDPHNIRVKVIQRIGRCEKAKKARIRKEV